MQKIMNILGKKVDKLLDKSVSPIQFLVAFLGIITIRVFVEQFVARAIPLNFGEMIVTWTHNLFLFFITFSLVWLYLSFYLRINPAKLSFFFSVASLLIIFPPLIDIWKTRGETFWSFYALGGARDLAQYFFSLLGNISSGIVYYGTRIVFLSGTVAIAGVVYLKTRSFIRSMVAAFWVYLIIFSMAVFPSLFSLLYYPLFLKVPFSKVRSFHIAEFFGSPEKIFSLESIGLKYSFAYKLDLIYFLLTLAILMIMFFLISREKFRAVLKNFRYPQVIYHSGLFFIGMGLGFWYYPDNLTLDFFSILAVFVLLTSIWMAWLASLVVNDLEDVEIDRLTNPDRPLPQGVFTEKQYIQLGAISLFLALLGGMVVGMKFFVLLVIYQIIAWFYSSHPFKLKRFPLLATMVGSLAVMMVFFMGFILLSDGQTIDILPWPAVFLLIIAYTISIPIKDFKDMAGDKKAGIWTIPVIFGEKKGKLIIASGIFSTFMLSVYLLNENLLFFPAILSGTIVFIVINSRKIKPKRLPWWVLGVVAVYGMILVKIVFF